MKKKSLALAAIAVLMVASLATALTLAYFTDTDAATNVFTVGNVDITLTEPAWNEGENPGKDMIATPGIEIPKDPTVTNDGTNDAYVRVLVTLDNAAAFQALAVKYTAMNNLASIFAGHDETLWARADISSDTDADTLTYVYNYKTVLESGDNTGAIFTSVTLPGYLTSDDMATLEDGFTITVVAQAIQADGFDTVEEAFDEWE